MRTAREIRRFIEMDLLDGAETGDPFADGMLDSLAIEQLIAFLEEKYRLTFDDDELVAENFASIDAVAALVDRKRKASR
jgi:acyl carrier protein